MELCSDAVVGVASLMQATCPLPRQPRVGSLKGGGPGRWELRRSGRGRGSDAARCLWSCVQRDDRGVASSLVVNVVNSWWSLSGSGWRVPLGAAFFLS
jgi:hypothetical protein